MQTSLSRRRQFYIFPLRLFNRNFPSKYYYYYYYLLRLKPAHQHQQHHYEYDELDGGMTAGREQSALLEPRGWPCDDDSDDSDDDAFPRTRARRDDATHARK